MPSRLELRAAFAIFDKDGNGRLSADELLEVLVKDTSHGVALTRADARTLIGCFDKDGDGQLDVEEFITLISTDSNLEFVAEGLNLNITAALAAQETAPVTVEETAATSAASAGTVSGGESVPWRLLDEPNIVVEPRHPGNPRGLLREYANYNLPLMRGVNQHAPCKLGGEGLLSKVVPMMRGHVETIACMLAANGGFACQAAMLTKGGPGMMTVAAGGRTFYFGDPLNALVFEKPKSLLSLLWHNLMQLDDSFDRQQMQGIIEGVAARVTTRICDFKDGTLPFEAVGVAEYGPREERRWMEGICDTPFDTPLEWVKSMWPHVFYSHVKPLCASPDEWPLGFGFALVSLARQTVPKLITAKALFTLAAECAIPMSKVDLTGWDDKDAEALAEPV